MLRRLSIAERDRIRGKIQQYAREPSSLGNNVKRLKASPYIRLRIGDWRVIMDDQGSVLAILKIGPRGKVYD